MTREEFARTFHSPRSIIHARFADNAERGVALACAARRQHLNAERRIKSHG